MTLGTEDGELLVSLEQILVVQDASVADSYDDNLSMPALLFEK